MNDETAAPRGPRDHASLNTMSAFQPVTSAELLPVLRTQRELLTPRAAWAQWRYGAFTDTRWCMVGALMAAAERHTRFDRRREQVGCAGGRAICAALEALHGPGLYPVDWQDMPGRTHEEVLEVIDRAIEVTAAAAASEAPVEVALPVAPEAPRVPRVIGVAKVSDGLGMNR